MEKSSKLLLVIILDVLAIVLLVLVILGFLPRKDWMGISTIIYLIGSHIFIYKIKKGGKRKNEKV